jgi:hypothetical protein
MFWASIAQSSAWRVGCRGEGRFSTDADAEGSVRKSLQHSILCVLDVDALRARGAVSKRGSVLGYTSITLEAEVGIGPLSPQLRDKNAHFPEGINLYLLNQTKRILTGLVSVLVSGAVDRCC